MGQRGIYWVPVYCDLFDSAKLLKTAAMMKIKDTDALAMKLIRLWTWAIQTRPDGVLEAEFPAKRLADICGYSGDQEEWMKILLSCRWLDLQPDGTRKIHNWELYGGKLLDAVAYNRQVKAAQRSPLVKAFERCQSPGIVAKYKALAELLRQDISEDQVIASATDSTRQTWDFWAHIRALT